MNQTFRAVAVYDLEGGFIGYAIQKNAPGVMKLQSINLWSEAETNDLSQQLARLNDQVSVLGAWPDVRDPEVQAILADETFMPPELEPAEGVDEEKSVFVWIEPPSAQNPFGRMDEEKSVIVPKVIMAPTPASMQARTKAAQELVARRRSGA